MNDPLPMSPEPEHGLPSRISKQLSFGWLGLAIGLIIAFAAFIVFAVAPRLESTDTPTYEGTPLDALAANFQLTDQQGATVSLADWQGRVVVLTFFDSQCQDTCPRTAADFRATVQALGDAVSSVVFVGINVNIHSNQVTDVAAATEQWHLDEIPTWHFLTGSLEELQPVWDAYNVAVMPVAEEGGELIHTPGVYLIDQAGYKRWYISIPVNETEDALEFTPMRELLVKHIRVLLEKKTYE